jgi:hypothetical protein
MSRTRSWATSSADPGSRHATDLRHGNPGETDVIMAQSRGKRPGRWRPGLSPAQAGWAAAAATSAASPADMGGPITGWPVAAATR